MCAQAAKKRGKGKKRAAAVDPLKCGVCEAVTEVVLSEVRCQAGGQRAFARAADTGHAHHPQRLDDGSTRSHSA